MSTNAFSTGDSHEILVLANVYHWATSACDMSNCSGVVWCCYAESLDKAGFQAIHEYLLKRDARITELATRTILAEFGPGVTVE